MENKRDRFVRMAEKRVNNALKAIYLIGNLSNRNNYDYSQRDISQMFSVIREEITMAEKRFNTKNKKQQKFKLLEKKETNVLK